MTFKDLAQGLLDPIRRKPRSSSKDATRAGIDNHEARKSAPQLTHSIISDATPAQRRVSAFIPSSGVRYSMASVTSAYDPFRFVPKSSSPLKPGTPGSTFGRRAESPTTSPLKSKAHARNFSAPHLQPSVHIRERIDPQKIDQALILHDASELETIIAEEQMVRMQIPTPFPSPRLTPASLDSQRAPNRFSRATDTSGDVTSMTPSTFAHATSAMANFSDPHLIRPTSRDSSQSSKDRAHPPASFPSQFYSRRSQPHDRSQIARPLSQDRSHVARPRSATKRYTISGMPSEALDPFSSELGRSPRFATSHREQYHREASPASRISISPTKSHRSSLDDDRPHHHNADLSLSKLRSQSATSTPSYVDKSLEFHTIIHHYSNCIHTSPPAARPLNEQPQIRLRSFDHYSEHSTALSLIEGSCFDCDTASRRDNETQILLQFNSEIGRLTHELAHLVSILESVAIGDDPLRNPPRTPTNRSFSFPVVTSPGAASSIAGHTTDSGSSTLSTLNTNAATDDTSVTSGSVSEVQDLLERQVLHLEDMISKVIGRRDGEIHSVWQGYSARWGPGTLGVVNPRRGDATSSRSSSRPTSAIFNAHDDTKTGRSTHYLRSSSRTSSVQSSPRKAQFAHQFYTELYGSEPESASLLASPSTRRTTMTDLTNLDRSQSQRSVYRTPARSLRHGREQSVDSAASSMSGVRSVSGTETGISYTSSDTPIGRMKVNWIRGLDED